MNHLPHCNFIRHCGEPCNCGLAAALRAAEDAAIEAAAKKIDRAAEVLRRSPAIVSYETLTYLAFQIRQLSKDNLSDTLRAAELRGVRAGLEAAALETDNRIGLTFLSEKIRAIDPASVPVED